MPQLTQVPLSIVVPRDSASNTGTLIASLVGGERTASVSDEGIAITAADSSHGALQYTLDGVTWTNVGAVSSTNALLRDGHRHRRHSLCAPAIAI